MAPGLAGAWSAGWSRVAGGELGVDALGFGELVFQDDDAAGGLQRVALVDQLAGAGGQPQLVAGVAAVRVTSPAMFLTAMCVASTPGSKPSSFSTAARTSLVLLSGSLGICLDPFLAGEDCRSLPARAATPALAKSTASSLRLAQAVSALKGRRGPSCRGRIALAFLIGEKDGRPRCEEVSGRRRVPRGSRA